MAEVLFEEEQTRTEDSASLPEIKKLTRFDDAPKPESIFDFIKKYSFGFIKTEKAASIVVIFMTLVIIAGSIAIMLELQGVGTGQNIPKIHHPTRDTTVTEPAQG